MLKTLTQSRNEMIELFLQLRSIDSAARSSRILGGLNRAKDSGKRLGRPQKYNDDIRAKILIDRKAGMSQRQLAKKYGISKGSIQLIIGARKKNQRFSAQKLDSSTIALERWATANRQAAELLLIIESAAILDTLDKLKIRLSDIFKTPKANVTTLGQKEEK